jgi:uncharacterized protein DUF6152
MFHAIIPLRKSPEGDADMKFKALALAAVAVTVFAAPALAHHSFAMFEAEKTVTLQGTVKEFEWTNPHAWLRIMVTDQASGKDQQWALEMGAPQQQARVGWKPDSVKPGDKVTVTIHPLKDGSRGGQFMMAVLPSGQTLGNGGQRPNARGE